MKPKTPKPKLAYSDCNSKASDNLWKTFVVQTLASEPDYSVQDSEEYDSDLEEPYSDSDFDYDSDDSSDDDDEIKVEKKKVEESGSSEYESDEEEEEDDHNNTKYYEWLEQLETLEYDKSDSVRGYDNGYDFNGYDYNGFDKDGYDFRGYDQNGKDRYGEIEDEPTLLKYTQH